MTVTASRRDVLKTVLAGTVGYGLSTGLATAGQDGSLADDEDVRWWWGPDEGPEGPNVRSDASPSVVDGTVYTTARNAYDPAGQGTDDYVPFGVYALDAHTGDYEWHYRDPDLDITNTTPNVVDGTVYVGAPEYLIAIDAQTGEELWRTEIHIGEETRLKTPTAWDGTVFIGGLEGMHAVDAETGDIEWVHSTPVQAGPREGTQFANVPPHVPSVVDGVVYSTVPRDYESIVALDAETGDEVWTYEPRDHDNDGYGVNDSVLTVANGTVYAGTTRGSLSSDGGSPYMDAFVALDAASGTKRWGTEFPDVNFDGLWTGPTVAGGTVYVGPDTLGGGDPLYALDAETGGEQWVFPLEDDATIRTMPTVADGVVYFAFDVDGGSPEDAKLLGVDADTGEERWRKTIYAAGGDLGSSPTVVDGTLYIGAIMDPGGVYAIEVEGDGSSVDSRVGLGTLGHHDAWAWQQETPPETPVETTAPTEAAGTPTTVAQGGGTTTEAGGDPTTEPPTQPPTTQAGGGTDGDDTDGDRATRTETNAAQPGMGVLEALAGIAGVGYYLTRRFADEED